MLVRAAGRRQQRHTSLQLTRLADSLHLPFLCPAQSRWNATHAAAPPAQPRLKSRPQSTSSSIPHHGHERIHARQLATAAEQFSSTSEPSQYSFPHPDTKDVSDNLRWDHAGRDAIGIASLKPRDLIFFNHHAVTQEETSKWKAGIGGTTTDLLQNLYTCLRVQRFERARLVIQRLATICHPQSYELLHAHAKYLGERLDALPTSTRGRQKEFEDMRSWFETELLEKDIPVDAHIFTIMLRAALAGLQGPKQERAVRRLVDECKVHGGEDMWEDVYHSDDYSPDEFLRLGAIVPELAELYTEIDDSLVASASEWATEAADELPSSDDLLHQDDIPAVLQVEQKGLGLTSLKEGLELANEALNQDLAANAGNSTLTPEQRERILEESASQAAINRWKAEDANLHKMGIHTSLEAKPLGALMWQWYSALLPVLRTELEECRKVLDDPNHTTRSTDDQIVYGAHLESVPLEQIAATTILYIMGRVAGGKDRDSDVYSSEMKLSRLTASLGKSVQNESDAEAQKKRAAAERKSKHAPKVNFGSKAVLFKKVAAKKQSRLPSLRDPSDLIWPAMVRVKLGSMLVAKLMETAKLPVTRQHPRTKEMITQLQPAFLHKTTYEHGRKQGFLSASPDLVEKLHRSPLGGLIAKRLPMVVEPLPWTDFSKGGYLNYSNPAIRFTSGDAVPRDYAHAAIEKGDLDQVFAALNVLGKTPWRVNEDVLRVQVDAWNSGEPIANFAPLNPKLETVERPADEHDAVAMRKYKQALKDADSRRAGYHSQRCFQNFQLEIARAFRKEKMYFPHNVDFRGRAYPIPPYLNHMGADNARALMKFEEAKELGADGLRWLKIHLANVYGYDKASLQEREDFVMEHLSDIYDSATNPLTGRRWWLQSEDAWQTLAACYELKNALDSADPTKFMSTLPIHQDGTCNGLQHYAALGGDAIGARQVNLEPGDRPSDVYSAVAEAVKAEVEKDSKVGHPIAKILHGRITRKVVKQPVMTNVYGVTYYGAREQVKKQLEELFPEIKKTDAVGHLVMASYVATKIFKSLGEMFRGAQAIQRWLGECADRISTCVTPEQIEQLQTEAAESVAFEKKRPGKRIVRQNENFQRMNISKQLFRSSVIWTTPLRLPVVQPYRTTKRRLVATNLQKIALQEPQAVDPVSKRKQLQGFPPNFIHSLDATHMMLSALKSNEIGLSFASIHDSFWTHASDVDRLGRVLRDAFVAMHTEDVVGRLRQEFVARYKGAFYLASVDVNSAVGRRIIEHQQTRRAKRGERIDAKQPWQVTELLREVERARLLNSEDAEERREGEEMVTAGSIFAAEEDAESAIALPQEISDSRLGEIPDAADTADAADMARLAEEANAIEDLTDAAPKDDGEVEGHADQESADTGASADVKEIKTKTKPGVKKGYVWLPLTFPAVPEKGDFDVTRLRQSQYFFH
ncbi:hypothetical protein MBLNU459_g2905t1 [Dothideomycetes sp. NU459]